MSPPFTTPRDALREMIAAGAVFTVRPRTDSLGSSFTYRVDAGGDRERCRAILAEVKRRPAQFLAGFRLQVADVADRGSA